jgi:hypothetical protein
MTELHPFFCTFGLSDAYTHHYVEIHAPNEDVARAVMVQNHGKVWGAVYSAHRFERLQKRWGYHKLATIRPNEKGQYFADHPNGEPHEHH